MAVQQEHRESIEQDVTGPGNRAATILLLHLLIMRTITDKKEINVP